MFWKFRFVRFFDGNLNLLVNIQYWEGNWLLQFVHTCTLSATILIKKCRSLHLVVATWGWQCTNMNELMQPKTYSVLSIWDSHRLVLSKFHNSQTSHYESIFFTNGCVAVLIEFWGTVFHTHPSGKSKVNNFHIFAV